MNVSACELNIVNKLYQSKIEATCDSSEILFVVINMTDPNISNILERKYQEAVEKSPPFTDELKG